VISQTAPRSASAGLDIQDLCEMAANGLVPMLDPQAGLFCYRLNLTSAGLAREGLSPRYTAMCLLGLHRFETRAMRSSPVETGAAFDALIRDLGWVDNIGDLGLLIGLCAVTMPERLTQVYSELDVRTALERFQQRATMEVAWFLAGLAHATLARVSELPDLPALSLKAYSMLSANQGRHGTFGHSCHALRGRIGSFADQVYPIYALTKFGEAFQDHPAIERARNCAEAICRAQGSLGQWWWHYDASTGKVFQRYPVYSVHQHGMAPMALFELGNAAGLDFSGPIYKGLAWIQGSNELGRDLREASSNLVWRSVYRRSRAKMYIGEFLDYLRVKAGTVPASDLDIKFECRPYELGWLLYGFSGRKPA